MHRSFSVVLGAVTLVAALGLGGCGDDTSSAPSPTAFPTSKPPTVPPTETGAPLPPAATLTDLMGRLADPSIPSSDKAGLVQHGTPADAAALDRFAKALHDSGYAPLTFEATDLTWAQDQPGNVSANITIDAGGPQAGTDLKFPMEFSPQQDSWQLTRQTADLLLQMGQQPTATPTR